ncbi:hypothetical protein EUGRSUZ_J01179 [Eucalyptus grandis]|uniref:Uncharacterized protein n=2 Tax=Eucalyptus grandis TaxID=71139 RepID=A0ACC3J5F0_EUCGR|nr:hypothetical protein EUGRSUZ_J01179 [Eucalyptus grandis]
MPMPMPMTMPISLSLSLHAQRSLGSGQISEVTRIIVFFILLKENNGHEEDKDCVYYEGHTKGASAFSGKMWQNVKGPAKKRFTIWGKS